jgi:type II secretory pathway component PulM
VVIVPEADTLIALGGIIGSFATLYTVIVKPLLDRVSKLEGRLEEQSQNLNRAHQDIGVLRGEIHARDAKLEVALSELEEFNACPSKTCPFKFTAG